jgi:chorismate lyase / 3-hydroxybenzoate synthase
MPTAADQSLIDPAVMADVVEPPGWVLRLLGAPRAEGVVERGGLALVSVRAEGVRELDERGTCARVTAAYRSLFAALGRCAARNPVRFWNHIPGLHDRVGPGLDRYMAFNAGRFAAMQEWFGGVDQVRRCVATASGIGHSGDDLVIHCLASVTPGVPVENPRQVPAYLYSKRFGPTPPCFARATVADLAGTRTLLVAGTASIRGEESVHIGDLGAQLHETLINMRAVITRGLEDERAGLERLREVRVYHPRPEDRAWLEDACARAFAGAAVEVLRADLCRSELLVEIEGVAGV